MERTKFADWNGENDIDRNRENDVGKKGENNRDIDKDNRTVEKEDNYQYNNWELYGQRLGMIWTNYGE